MGMWTGWRRRSCGMTHICGCHCLGPLTFNMFSKGSNLSLTGDGRLATRSRDTFRNGLLFTERHVHVGERVGLRVEVCAQHWHGALRVGFTTVPPSGLPVPLPDIAVPNLTDRPGYWAALVPEAFAFPGSVLHFWVTRRGVLVLRCPDGQKWPLLEGLDVKQKLWAMVDVYGQTGAVLLLRSKKKDWFGVRRSCPVPQAPPIFLEDSCLCSSRETLCLSSLMSQEESRNAERQDKKTEDDCAVCLSQPACITLSCGHHCLCQSCFPRVRAEFHTCPICRQFITGYWCPSERRLLMCGS